MTQQPVVVVGAGAGGLACAIALASQGVAVTVLERAAQAGGKVRQVDVAGRAIDAGPTVFTMRWVLDELFDDAGSELADHLLLQPAHTLARHAWDADAQLDLHADIGRSADAIARFATPAEGRRYVDFCSRAGAIYETLEAPFLRGARPTPWSLTGRVLAAHGRSGVGRLAGISPFVTLWSELGKHFHDPRLRQLFGRYATYCGSSPYLSTATLMLVAHVERDGVWLVEGGMQSVARALVDLATRLGVRLHCGAHVEAIETSDDRVRAVRLADGTRIACDTVVYNGDASALAQGLLGADVARATPAVPARRRSLSAVTWNLVARTSGFPLLHHGVFFGADYAAEFDDIFRHGRLPADPTVYVCAQDRTDTGPMPGSAAATAPERLLCLVNAPSEGVAGTHPTLTEEELERCTTRMLDRLARCGLTLDTGATPMRRTTPADFARMFPGSHGALYGRASHGWMASFQRPGARSRVRGLYLAGGTVHPGPGVPMAALSGRQAAASVLADRPSTSRSLPAATPGGISTR